MIFKHNMQILISSHHTESINSKHRQPICYQVTRTILTFFYITKIA